MRKTRCILFDSKGLTLIELMIVLVLSLLLMSAVYLAYQLQHRTSQVQFQISAAQQDLRAVVEIISADIRHAGADPTFSQTIAGIPADESGPNYLRMVMDLNSDGVTTATGENISYQLNGTNLERFDINPNILQVLAQNVTTFGLTYWGEQSDGTVYQIVPTGPANPPEQPGNTLGASQISDVRFIDVRVEMRTAQNDPDTGNPISRSLSRRICRRNGIEQ